MPDRYRTRKLRDVDVTATHFYWDAEGFLNVAKKVEMQRVVAGNYSQLKAFYYLLGHSLELSLKGLLRHNGKSVGKLKRKHGHNLCSLKTQATELGMVSFDCQESELLEDLNVSYNAKGLEYTTFKVVSVPSDYTWDCPAPC